MNTQHLESIPTTWTDDRDVAFFRVVRDLFGRSFLDGATVLLASFDEDVPDETTHPSARQLANRVDLAHA